MKLLYIHFSYEPFEGITAVIKLVVGGSLQQHGGSSNKFKSGSFLFQIDRNQ